MRTLRVGAGAGYSGDRIEPAVELAENGGLDYLVFECLAERTIALAQQIRLKDPAAGFDRQLETRLRAVLPACARQGVKIVTNMGAANPRAAAEAARQVARELGFSRLKIAAVTGDDVLDVLRASDARLDNGATLSSLGNRVHIRQRLYRRAADRRGAGGRRGHRDHRARRRSRAVHGAADRRIRLGDGRLDAARTRGRWSVICSNARDRSPAAISPIPASRIFRTSRGSDFRSARSTKAARSSSPRSRVPAAR